MSSNFKAFSKASVFSAVLLTGYSIIVLLPLVLSYIQDQSSRGWRTELSTGIAMVAFAMLLMEFVLSGRFKTITSSIGIDLTLRFHQLMARVMTIAILAHPYIYMYSGGSALDWDIAATAAPQLDGVAFITGAIAWLLLPLLTLFAIFRDHLPYRYETWRISHGVGAAFIAIAGTVHALRGGHYSDHAYLAAYWYVMLALALTTLVYVYLIRPWRMSKQPYQVVKVENVGLKTWEIVVEPTTGASMPFEAGQFCWLKLGRSPFAITEHPFSISSAPAELPALGFTIKEAGDFTNRIGQIPLGARAYVDGPYGRMRLEGRDEKGIVFIAGGVGFAPIISMLRQLHADCDKRPLILIYGNRIDEQILYADEIKQYTRELNLTAHQVLSEPPPDWQGEVGWLDHRVLNKLVNFEGHSGWLYVVCGPTPMVDSVESALAALDVRSSQILCEKFSYS